MQHILAVLKPLATPTKQLSNEKLPSVSLVQLVLTALLNKHLHLDPAIVTELKNYVAKNINSHFPDDIQQMDALIASVLDQRYKSLKMIR